MTYLHYHRTSYEFGYRLEYEVVLNANSKRVCKTIEALHEHMTTVRTYKPVNCIMPDFQWGNGNC